jgi:RHS repeat-associated protein
MAETVGYGTSAQATTLYTYDKDGNVATITDPDSNTTSYTYDANGNVLTTVTPIGTTTDQYDKAGNLTYVMDPLGRKQTMVYDDNRLMTKTWYNADGSVANVFHYTYDPAGNMTSAGNDAGSYTMTYDGDQLLTQTDPNGLTLTYGYDDNGNVTSVQDSLGGLTTSVYDGNQLMSRQFSGPDGEQLREDFTYDHAGNVQTQKRYADLAGTDLVGTTQNTYDGDQLTNIVQTDGSGSTLASYSYSYDHAGRLMSEIDNGVTTSYAYDSTGQLIAEGAQVHAYDKNGNGNNPGDVIGPDNELLSDGVWDYAYDAAGNLVKKVAIADGTTWTYGYDLNNQMTSAVETDASGDLLQSLSFTYDVFGNRIEKSVTTAGSGTTVQRFAYDTSGNAWADLDGSGSLTTRRIYGDGMDQPLARISGSGEIGWYLTDRLGSVRVITDGTGAAIDRINYDAFGAITSESNPAAGDRFKAFGYQYDQESRLYWVMARYFDPETHIFLSQDPQGLAAGPNPYEYANNDPTNSTDPMGLDGTTAGKPSGLYLQYFSKLVQGAIIQWYTRLPVDRRQSVTKRVAQLTQELRELHGDTSALLTDQDYARHIVAGLILENSDLEKLVREALIEEFRDRLGKVRGRLLDELGLEIHEIDVVLGSAKLSAKLADEEKVRMKQHREVLYQEYLKVEKEERALIQQLRGLGSGPPKEDPKFLEPSAGIKLKPPFSPPIGESGGPSAGFVAPAGALVEATGGGIATGAGAAVIAFPVILHEIYRYAYETHLGPAIANELALELAQEAQIRAKLARETVGPGPGPAPEPKPKTKPKEAPKREPREPKEPEDKRPGRVRSQVQDSQAGKTLHTASDLAEEQQPYGRGVTVRQVQASLKKLYDKVRRTRWYPSELYGELGSAIVSARRRLNEIPAQGGVQGTTGILRRTWHGTTKAIEYRLDIENLNGWNLRFII